MRWLELWLDHNRGSRDRLAVRPDDRAGDRYALLHRQHDRPRVRRGGRDVS